MMSSTSSCMDGYGNFMMHQPQVSSNFYNQSNNNQQRGQQQQGNGSYAYPGDWAVAPLIKSPAESRHKKLYPSRSNGYEYDESSMSRLAKHTHGAPIIMSSRYRSKTSKPIQPFGHENGNLRNQNAFTKAPPSSDEMQNCDDNGYHANGTCLPRIIKPRKRRKKDRKPLSGAAMENNPPSPFTFASNQSNGFMQSNNINNNNGSYPNQMNENFKRPTLPNDSNLFFNCDFDPNIVLPLPSSSVSSSPISLSNSSLSSSTTASSCSCRLCDPNCRIWAFPLRRSFSDNSAAELDHHNNNSSSDCVHIETSRKDVGVIGGNRVKSEWNSGVDPTLSILDMIEFNDYKNNQQQSLIADVNANRLRSESSSDSGDSGCDLLLGRLNISDDILSSTMKTVSDGLTSQGINEIAKHLSEFTLMSSVPDDSENIFISEDRLDTFQFNTIRKSLSSCEFNDRQQNSNLDNLLAASSSGNSNYGNNLMSPMLVNKQNFSNNLDLNNNHHGTAPVVDGCGLKERTFFDCFDETSWKGS